MTRRRRAATTGGAFCVSEDGARCDLGYFPNVPRFLRRCKVLYLEELVVGMTGFEPATP